MVIRDLDIKLHCGEVGNSHGITGLASRRGWRGKRSIRSIHRFEFKYNFHAEPISHPKLQSPIHPTLLASDTASPSETISHPLSSISYHHSYHSKPPSPPRTRRIHRQPTNQPVCLSVCLSARAAPRPPPRSLYCAPPLFTDTMLSSSISATYSEPMAWTVSRALAEALAANPLGGVLAVFITHHPRPLHPPFIIPLPLQPQSTKPNEPATEDRRPKRIQDRTGQAGRMRLLT